MKNEKKKRDFLSKKITKMSIKRSSVDIERWLIAQKIRKKLHEMIVKQYFGLNKRLAQNSEKT